MQHPAMLKALILLAALPSPDDPIQAAARSVVERLAEGAFEQVAPPKAPPHLDAKALRKGWEEVARQAGPFQGIDDTRLERRPTGDYAYVRCRFGGRAYDARMLLGPDRKLQGFTLIPAPLGGPGLIRAQGYFQARPRKGVGTITFPVPGTYRDQVPLTFSVRSIPADAVKGYRWKRREDGRNWLCEVEVAPPPSGAYVKWESLVLVGDRPRADLPHAPEPECPDEAKPWTRSTACVQSDDPDIRAKARELAQGDVAAYVRKAVGFAATNPVRMRPGSTLDARCALDTGSSCTGRANLAAALLRARGIPARTVAHLPTWSGPLFEHWLVEYWHPGAGWTWVEPSLNRIQPEPWMVAVLNVAEPEDEDSARSFAPYAVRSVMAGAPRLSVPELSDGLGADNSPFPDGETSALATPEAPLKGGDFAALFTDARNRFEALTRKGLPEQDGEARVAALIRAAREGGPDGLRKALGG